MEKPPPRRLFSKRLGPWSLTLGLGIFSLWPMGCQINTPECDSVCLENWLDGPRYADSSHESLRGTPGFNPRIRLSTRDTLPDSSQLNLPVVLCVHGFTASTFEWKEFADSVAVFNAGRPDSILVSRVLLGGHGGDLSDFEASGWRDWLAPILAEYDTLVARGYRNISLAASSAGAALLLEAFAAKSFRKQPPREVFFVDPFIVPTDKFLTLAPLIGPLIGNVEAIGTEEEQKHWYSNRPAEQLTELYTLANRVKNRLESGQNLPPGVSLKVYKSRHDESADPVGALYLKKGLHLSSGAPVEVEMISSRLHVFTRLAGRKSVTAADSAAQRRIQSRVFSEMMKRINRALP